MSVRHEAVVPQRSRRLQHLLPVAGEVETSHAQHQIQCRRAGGVTMARWPRLYHERVAWLFGRGLYWLRFAGGGENDANTCFLALVYVLEPRGSMGS